MYQTKQEKEITNILRKYKVDDLKIVVTDTHGKIFTSDWTSEVKSTLKDDLINLIAQAQQEAVERDREEFIERLRNAMDEYNSLPENAMQFAFYLKVQDVGRFFKALQKEQE